MDSAYSSLYPPGVAVSGDVVKFFRTFYQVSDTPDAHERYADMYTKDATFILASKFSSGYDEILTTRKGMWAAVSSRKHTPTKIFPFGEDSKEYMLYGTVNYTFKTGQDANVDWAARAVLSEVDGALKLKFYQVYLDTAAASKKN